MGRQRARTRLILELEISSGDNGLAQPSAVGSAMWRTAAGKSDGDGFTEGQEAGRSVENSERGGICRWCGCRFKEGVNMSRRTE